MRINRVRLIAKMAELDMSVNALVEKYTDRDTPPSDDEKD